MTARRTNRSRASNANRGRMTWLDTSGSFAIRAVVDGIVEPTVRMLVFNLANRYLFSEVELFALRRVAPRSAAQRLPANGAVCASRSAAARACAAEATRLTTHMSATSVDELISSDAASAPRRRGGVVAARQPLPLNTCNALAFRADCESIKSRRDGRTSLPQDMPLVQPSLLGSGNTELDSQR